MSSGFDPLLGLVYPLEVDVSQVQRVRVTRPPFRCIGGGRLLVVGVRRNEGLELVLAYEKVHRFPRQSG